MTLLAQSGATIGSILLAMAVVALVETVIPLHSGERASRAHLGPNMALTFITFATNLVLNTTLVVSLMVLSRFGLGLLNAYPQPPVLELAVVLLGLDLSFYVAHVAMHKIPAFWNYHLVHHSDPVVGVTTTIRQHPGESVIRYTFMGAFAFALGAGPSAFAVYRAWSALNGLLEHANIRLPLWLDRLIALVSTWPNMHKVHHSRVREETDTNYGNIFSFWDRIFFTFTPSSRGTDIRYGLDGFDDPSAQTLQGLLGLPFSSPNKKRAGVAPEVA
jgi:sterol desaturase/sphingolipid hydroxylase (fatty acid hydroxylase superfamily)